MEAQSYYQEYKSRIDYILQHMDKSKITSGLLSDYAWESIDIASYNGRLADSNYVDAESWLGLYSSIYDAKINNNIQLKSPAEVVKMMEGAYETIDDVPSSHPIPVFIMHYEYDKLDDDAYNKGYVEIINDQVKEIAGKPSPYLKKDLFAAAPVRRIVPQGSYHFMLRDEYIFRNTTKNILKIELAVNNKNALVPVTLNTPISLGSKDYVGEYTFYFRITYEDYSYVISQSNIWFGAMDGPSKANGEEKNYVDAKVDIKSTAKHSGATLEIHYGANNEDKKIKKPLIIAKPLALEQYLASMKKIDLNRILKEDGFSEIYDQLDNYLSYDIIFVDYKNGMDDIFRNAALFEDVIRYVNERKDKETNHPNVVLGMNIGGVIARYALSNMEQNKEDHETSKFISLDAPHKGLNFPIGLQGLIRHLKDFKLEVIFIPVWKYVEKGDNIDQLYKMLNTTAMRQLLMYYCDENINMDNSVHEAFQKEYDRLGFPQKCHNVAIANGSNQGTLLFNQNAKIFQDNIDIRKFWCKDIVFFCIV